MKILFKKLKNLFFKKSTKNLSAFVIKIASKMIKDWTHSPYQDKIRIESQNKKIYYKCEDDSEIIIDYLNSKLEFNNNFVTFSNITDREENYIIELISDFLTTAKIRTKSYEEQIKDEFEKNFSDYDSHRNQSNNRNNRNNRNYSNWSPPKSRFTDEQLKHQKKYQTISDVHNAKVSEVNKQVKVNGKYPSNRIDLMNELKVLKRKMNLIKPKTGWK